MKNLMWELNQFNFSRVCDEEPILIKSYTAQEYEPPFFANKNYVLANIDFYQFHNSSEQILKFSTRIDGFNSFERKRYLALKNNEINTHGYFFEKADHFETVNVNFTKNELLIRFLNDLNLKSETSSPRKTQLINSGTGVIRNNEYSQLNYLLFKNLEEGKREESFFDKYGYSMTFNICILWSLIFISCEVYPSRRYLGSTFNAERVSNSIYYYVVVNMFLSILYYQLYQKDISIFTKIILTIPPVFFILTRTVNVGIWINSYLSYCNYKFKGLLSAASLIFYSWFSTIFILLVLSSFFIGWIVRNIIENGFYIVLTMSFGYLPFIIINFVKKERIGFSFIISISLMLLSTLPFIYIMIVADPRLNRDIKDIFNDYFFIFILLAIQILISCFYSMQFYYGSLWFWPKKWRGIKKEYVGLIHEEFELEERLNDRIPNCCIWGNGLEDYSLFQDHSHPLVFWKEHVQVLKKLEKTEGAYFKSVCTFCNNWYHIKCFKNWRKDNDRCIWGGILEWDLLNFDD